MRGRRRADHDVVVLPVELGPTDLDAVVRAVQSLLRDPALHVVVDVQRFSYFDERALLTLDDLASSSGGRVEVQGLDRYAMAVQAAAEPLPGEIDLRDRPHRAVSLHNNVAIGQLVVDGRPLGDAEVHATLTLLRESGRRIVTVDLRALQQLSPATQIGLAELSGDLAHERRTLLLVNAEVEVANQLRTAGLSGGLHLAVEEPRWH